MHFKLQLMHIMPSEYAQLYIMTAQLAPEIP